MNRTRSMWDRRAVGARPNDEAPALPRSKERLLGRVVPRGLILFVASVSWFGCGNPDVGTVRADLSPEEARQAALSDPKLDPKIAADLRKVPTLPVSLQAPPRGTSPDPGVGGPLKKKR